MNLIDKIPPLLTDMELTKALSKYPHYDSNAHLTKSERLLKLLDMYDLFIPTKMSVEIYNTLYFALVRSFKRKSNLYNNNQMLKNRKVINGASITSGVNGGDCSLLVGESGVGKTQAITRAINVISPNTIEINNPYCSIIPIMVVEASPNVSIKGFFFEILRVMDSILDTNYLKANMRSTVNSDELLASVSNALLLHCGVLIIDEIDRLVGKKNSITFVNYLTELINMCGVSIVFCGTTQSLDFFQITPYLARRSLGNIYHSMEYGEDYYIFCKELFQYQYTIKKIELNSEILRLLYKLTNGNIALTVQLFVEAQKYALSNDTPSINADILAKTFTNKMSIILPHISLRKTNLPSTSMNETMSIAPKENVLAEEDNIFFTLPQKSEKSIDKAIEILSQSVSVEVIQI